MSKSSIEWTQETWNPTTGCNKVSQGCKNCYAETMHKRLQGMGQPKYKRDFNKGVMMHDDALDYPLTIKKPTMFFVNSMSDLFHDDVTFEFIDKVFATMAATPQHTYQVLTKRAEIMKDYFAWKQLVWRNNYQPLPNVWLGVSCEDQTTADERIPYLLKCPAAVRFLSCEPLLGPIDLETIDPESPGGNIGSINAFTGDENCFDHSESRGGPIHWVIAGGESGHGARPMHPEWVRSLRDQCADADVPFFFKQWGEYRPFEETCQAPFYRDCATGEEHDGHVMNMIDYDHYTESGLFNGYRWFPPMDAITYCMDHNNSDCSFLKMGKSKSGNHLNGVQHLNFPTR